MQLPDFFVIGAQKAGSTYLLECLAEHPDIFMPPEEIAFFEDSLYAAERIEAFARNFAAARPGQVVGVKRPNLLGHPECVERLSYHMPQLKLVVVLRDPIQRAVSGYFHYMGTGLIPLAPIEVGLERLLEGGYDQFPRAAEVISFSLYHTHLENYRERFGRDQIFVSLLDDIKVNPQRELSRLYEWLGVSVDYRPTSIARRPMQAAYSLTRIRLREILARPCRRWTDDGKYFSIAKGPIPRLVNGINVALDRGLWSRLFPASPPRLSKELRERLNELFQPEIDALEKWLDRDLSSWR